MDEPGGHYAEWNKPGMERQMPTYMWNLDIHTYENSERGAMVHH